MSDKKMSNLKPVISIVEACKLVNLSRARFYQLLEQGIFPQPLYHIRTKRPYYDTDLQKKLLEIRDTCVGDNGDLVLFYSPRKTKSTSTPKKKKVDPMIKELAEILNSMGLETTTNRVKQGLAEIYPDGIGSVDQGVVIRELFRSIKSE
jgi:hypothetical protein